MGFNGVGIDPFLASLGLDTYGGDLRRGRRNSSWNLRGRAQGAMMEKGLTPLGLEPSWQYLPFKARWREGLGLS